MEKHDMKQERLQVLLRQACAWLRNDLAYAESSGDEATAEELSELLGAIDLELAPAPLEGMANVRES